MRHLKQIGTFLASYFVISSSKLTVNNLNWFLQDFVCEVINASLIMEMMP